MSAESSASDAVREADVTRAVEEQPDTTEVPRRNVATLNAMGKAAITRLLESLVVLCLFSATAGAQQTPPTRTKVLKTVGRTALCSPAPGLSGWRLDGKTLWSLARVLEDRKAPVRGVVVSFFATWCAPCRAGLKALQRLEPYARRRGIAIVVVAVPPFPADLDVAPYLKGLGVTLPAIRDKFGGIRDQWLAQGRKAAKVALPRTVLINDARQLVAAFGIEGRDFGAVLRSAIDRVGSLCKAPKAE